MKPSDRSRLTTALRDQVAKIAADLRTKMRAPGATRDRAKQLHTDEQVAEDFDVWTDLLSRRAAVLWVLKSVYVRVLEDRKLLTPGRLLDPEAQQLFERLAPHLGETAFLRWIYRDLASKSGGLPELFSPQPAEVAAPSDELSRALIAFWRHRDADSGAQWSFADEHFEGELMGDLYQELDPVVKDRFALCQTPDFVRAFILDRTLTPAIETFGADKVRLLDPACGSGHFLIDGLKRLFAATTAMHPDWPREKTARHVLDRVVGVDLNDYACGLARARLVMTAAELANVSDLVSASQYHPHVYWADGLEQVERDDVKKPVQTSLFEKTETKPVAVLTRSDVRDALKKVYATKFHAVVANPPYITEKDAARKDYHREKIGKTQRYVSAYREYSLGSPFTERCFQLAEKEGYVGIITSNNFMKREFGKPLIEKVLAGMDLSLVVDTAGAILADSGFETPTVILIGQNRKPSNPIVSAIMGKKKDTSRDGAYSERPYWRSILAAVGNKGYEDDYVSVEEVQRTTFAKHPWSLGGGGSSGLKTAIEARTEGSTLRRFAEPIGFMCITKQDNVFVQNASVFLRQGCEADWTRALGSGDMVRDWAASAGAALLFPYDSDIELRALLPGTGVARYLWRYRRILEERAIFGGETFRSAKRPWWEYGQIPKERFRSALSIAFSFITTHNQFVLDHGGKVFNRSAPTIKLPIGATEEDHLSLLGILNSSTACFWFRQSLHFFGARSRGTKIQSEEWAQFLEFAGGRVEELPIPKSSKRVAEIARHVDALASRTADFTPSAVLNSDWSAQALSERLRDAQDQLAKLRAEMVAWQEELDWVVYADYGILDAKHLPSHDLVPEPIGSAHRPFAILLARKAAAGEATHYWFEAMQVEPTTEVPDCYRAETRARIEARLALIEANPDLAMLETPECKRKWEPLTWDEDLKEAALAWLSDAIEAAERERGKPATRAHLVAAVQADPRFLAVAALYQQRQAVDLDSLVAEIMTTETVPNHPFHIYTDLGLAKRAAWEDTWDLQRREDAGEKIDDIPVPPEYSQGSRGKSVDFLKTEYWKLRGALDVPKERFIAFTEVPGRTGADTLYGWAGWTPLQRLRAILAIDEELEDAGVSLADRTGLLDSAWRLLPDVAREDAAAAARLKAELQALVGPEGPSREMLEDWKKRFPPPSSRAVKTKGSKAKKTKAIDEDGEVES